MIKLLLRYYWYNTRNFVASLTVSDILVLLLAIMLVALFLLTAISQILSLSKDFILSHHQKIINIIPIGFAIITLLSRVVIQSEKQIDRLYNDRGFFFNLPAKIISIVNALIFFSLLKDCFWIFSGFLFTGIIAITLKVQVFETYGTTFQLVVLWVITASLVSFFSMTLRLIVSNLIRFEKKFLLKLLTLIEIILSLIIFVIIMFLRNTIRDYMTDAWQWNNTIVTYVFFIPLFAFLWFSIRKVFTVNENAIKKYFESKNDYYSSKEFLPVVNNFLDHYVPTVVSSIIRLSLSTRFLGFTKVQSLLFFLIQAAILLFASTFVHGEATSVVFSVIAAFVIAVFYLSVAASLPYFFTIVKTLPFKFKTIVWSYLFAGIVLILPSFFLIVIISFFLRFNNIWEAVLLTLFFSLSIIPLRLAIAFRYPFSKTLADIAFLLTLFMLFLFSQLSIFLIIIGVIVFVLFHLKKASVVWNSPDL